MTTPSAESEPPQPAKVPIASSAGAMRRTEASSNAPSAHRPRSATTPLLWVVSLLIAYVLSPLPVGVALDLLPAKYALPAHRAFRTVYAPIVWVSNRVPQVHAFYEWYEDLFDV